MEADEFTEILNSYEGQLIGYACTFLGNVESAKDAVQDTFLRLWNHRTDAMSVKPWLYTTCRNRCIDMLRREKRILHVDSTVLESKESSSPRPDEIADGNDQHRIILNHLKGLSQNQQEVIRLKFEADFSYREISDVTGLNEGNVGFLLHTGLKKLRSAMTSTPRSSSNQEAADL